MNTPASTEPPISFASPSALHEPDQQISVRAINILIVTACLGFLGAWLFKDQGAGLNILLGVALLYGGAWALRGEGCGNLLNRPWFPMVLLGFAACVAWRDSEILNFLAGMMILLLLALAASGEIREAWRLTFGRAVLHLMKVGAYAVGGFMVLVATEVEWQGIRRRPVVGQLWSGLVGLVIATPLALLFAALFSSADAVYAERLREWLHFDWVEAFRFFFLAGVIWWLTAGYLRKLVATKPPEEKVTSPEESGGTWLGGTEVNVVLAVLNLLFLSFVVVQVKYLFGGEHLVQVTPGMGFADYARRGFFELVTVAGLVLPLLLVADWIYPRSANRTPLKLLTASLIGLLLVVMISAARRMQLYQAEYGLTELRFYVSAFMLLLAAVFAWFAVTVLRDRRSYFLSGAATLGAAMVLILHVVNPDGWIARVNLDRGAEGKLFDPEYAAKLSADALPVLLAGLRELPEEHREALAERLQVEEQSWKEWNWGNWKARQAWTTESR